MESQDTHVHDDGAVHQNHNSDEQETSKSEPTGHSHDGENYHTH